MTKSVTVYTKPNCMQCNFTKQFLKENNIAFSAVDIMEDEKALEAVKSMGFSSLPVVVIEGEEPFNGFRPDRLEALV